MLLQMQGENNKLHIKTQNLRNSRLPNAEMRASQRFNFGRSLNRENVYQDVSSRTTDMSLNVEMPLFDGFTTRYALKANTAGIQASDENIIVKKDELRLNIVNLFYRVVIYKEIHQIALEQKKLTKNQIERIKTRLEAGMASKNLLLETQAQLADDELKITETKANTDIALIELAQLMNLTEHIAVFDISIEESAVRTLPFAQSNKGVELDKFPRYQAAHYQLQQLEWNYKKVRSGYLPSLSLGGSVGSSYYNQSGAANRSFSEQLRNNQQTYVYVALRIPLFDKFITRDNLRGVQQDIQNQQLALQETINNLHTEALKIESDLQHTYQKVETANQSVTAHAEAFRFATEMFNAGKLSVYEHLQAKQRLADSRSRAAQAKYELAYKLVVFEYYHK